MIQSIYQKAMKFAGEKHASQKVPGSNANYLLHLSNVAMEILIAYTNSPNFNMELAIPVAILHDTIEDTNTTFAELENLFGQNVAEGVLALSKDDTLASKEEQMQDSLKRIQKLSNEIGMVKMADRITNLQEPPNYWTKEKKIKYLKEAEVIVHHLGSAHQYLRERLEKKIKAYRNYL